MKGFVVDIAQRLDMGLEPQQYRIGVVTFATNPMMEFNFVAYTNASALEAAMVNVVQPTQGLTGTAAAIGLTNDVLFTVANGYRDGMAGTPVAVLMTDGQSNIGKENDVSEATRLKSRGIELYAMAVGIRRNSFDDAYRAELKADLLQLVSGDTVQEKMEHYTEVNNFNQLSEEAVIAYLEVAVQRAQVDCNSPV